ncbi:imidazoleglycerol-phosphate dehydratase [Pycnococcus provasolii]|uniref:Imidazoleglycerol-phosphate dehydratase n=1 Tax=Pycnococcus provasolii TaxID=41880 RepID=A0A830HTF1_9CHLO|nr:imidazoleglycerol-phosphate dehydratase [Pycnococcus provasolii]
MSPAAATAASTATSTARSRLTRGSLAASLAHPRQLAPHRSAASARTPRRCPPCLASSDVSSDVSREELVEQIDALKRRNEQLEAMLASSGSASANGSNNGSERRVAEVKRATKETDIRVFVNIDGTGKCDVATGVGFLDHMLDQLAKHGMFDLEVSCKGDLWIDDHHTTEDVAIALGQCFADALGNKAGIRRFGSFTAPLDEALIDVTLDLSGRPSFHLDGWTATDVDRIGDLSTQMVEHFLHSFATTAKATMHVRQLAGTNSHHIVEATFKAMARALRVATEYDSRLGKDVVPSSKGTI